MSTTTQILFNSPALHSLKRDQLVKLCKIHSLKASGKNKDLIQRLKLHAKTLPPNDPLNIAVRSEDLDAKPVSESEDDASDHSAGVNTPNNTISRPSEQWEVVMDTITEVDEETLRNNRGDANRQVSEFGTNISKGSVTSSLRVLATSLGLKRNTSKSNGIIASSSGLSSEEVTQSSSTLPNSNLNCSPEELPVEPIPGQTNLQGLPAPASARLSFSQTPATTTIRLVSNPTTNMNVLLSPPKLKPFTTSFDLVPATPSGPGTSTVPVWPLSPGSAARKSLYPAVPTFEGFSSLLKQHCVQSSQYDTSDMDIDLDIPGPAIPSILRPTPEKVSTSTRLNTGATPKSTQKPSAETVDIFSPAHKLQDTSPRSTGILRSGPFVFGSPLPQNNTSNLHFRDAAQSVLDEMNKRLAEEGVDTLNVSVFNNRRTTTEESTGREENNTPPRHGVADVFEKIHQKEFDKMDSITSHYAAKRGPQGTAPEPILSKKRKSSLVVKERQSRAPTARHCPNGSRVASGASVKILPGSFGEESDEDEVADRRMSKRPRVEHEESDAPAQPERISIAPPPDPEEESKKQKEREAIRRRLDRNKAKRRSSMGRPSIGHAAPANAKPVRLGFFATAKSLVRNVWNRGAGSKTPSNIPVSKPAQPKEGTNAISRATEAKKRAAISGSSGAPPLGSQTKRIPSGGSNTSLQSNAPARSILAQPTGGIAAVSRIWKSPTPSLDPSGSSAAAKSSTVAGHGQSSNRNSSLVGFSSLGSRAGASANNTGSSSMGAKSNFRTSATSLQKPVTSVARSRTSSTLMAPTASSLAKTNPHSRVPVSSESSIHTKGSVRSKLRLAVSPPHTITLEQITNSPQSPAHAPRPAKVFSQPLSPSPTSPPMSLTAAATTIIGQTTEKPSTSSKPPLPPKPKVLPGRKPRISRSRVIARLASQRAAAGASGGTPAKTGGKVRSSTGAEVAGKGIRQSYAGARGGDLMMSAKKRVRQSEHARRKSRVHFAEEEHGMDVD